jgi:hypothetical protein
VTDQDRAASALRHLDPTCPHEEWVRLGMAAKAAGLTVDDSHTWCATADTNFTIKTIPTLGILDMPAMYNAGLDLASQELVLLAKQKPPGGMQ